MAHSESSPKRDMHSITGLPQEVRKISNRQCNLRPKETRKEKNKQSPK